MTTFQHDGLYDQFFNEPMKTVQQYSVWIALAIAALRSARIDVGNEAIARGLTSVHWPARFQVWDERTVVDGAHNPSGAQVLAETWRQQFGDERATIILAVLRDKDIVGIWRALAPIAQRVILPRARSERAPKPTHAPHLSVGE